MDKAYNEILDFIDSLEIIDTHEHLPSNEDDRERDTDVLREYLSSSIGELPLLQVPGMMNMTFSLLGLGLSGIAFRFCGEYTRRCSAILSNGP